MCFHGNLNWALNWVIVITELFSLIWKCQQTLYSPLHVVKCFITKPDLGQVSLLSLKRKCRSKWIYFEMCQEAQSLVFVAGPWSRCLPSGWKSFCRRHDGNMARPTSCDVLRRNPMITNDHHEHKHWNILWFTSSLPRNNENRGGYAQYGNEQ